MSAIHLVAPTSRSGNTDICKTPAVVSRASGRYAPPGGNGRTYVYEASWEQMCGFLVWNCTMWKDDLRGVFRGGSMHLPLGDAWEQVRSRIERAIDEDVSA